MDDERQMILKMLSEGKISVEEANALLDVLNEGGLDEEPAGFTPKSDADSGSRDTKEEPRARVHEHRHESNERAEDGQKKHGFKFDLDFDLGGLKDSLRETMGSLREAMEGVGDTLKDAFEGIDFSDMPHAVFRVMGRERAEDERVLSESVGDATGFTVVGQWGDVRVTGADTSQIDVKARIAAWAKSEDEARDAVSQVDVALRRDGDKIVLDLPASSQKGGVRIDVECTVPRTLAVSVTTASGDLWLEDLEGSQAVNTASGDITVANLGSRLEDTQVIQTKSGDVVAAVLTGESSISSASGDVQINGFSGALSANSHSGDIEVSEGRGSVQLKALSGDVELTLEELGSDGVTVSSVSGDVHVTIPSGSAVDVDAKTGSGDVNVDLELENAQRSGKKVTGSANGGGTPISLVTVSGDVSLDD